MVAIAAFANCGICSRRLQGNLEQRQAALRCRYPLEYATSNGCHPKTVYVREAVVLQAVEPWLARIFDEDHIEGTLAALTAAIEEGTGDVHDAAAADSAREAIARCDTRLKSYKEALDEGGDATVIGKWISETSVERALAAQVLASATARPGRPAASAADQAAALLADLRAAAAALGDADAAARNRCWNSLASK